MPPNQAESMVDALRPRRLPVAYVAFEGEQHGFRQAANIDARSKASICSSLASSASNRPIRCRRSRSNFSAHICRRRFDEQRSRRRFLPAANLTRLQFRARPPPR